jgi:hypothetical protein
MDKEERIRQRAYELWYVAGCHHGRDAEHWARAVEEIEGAFIKGDAAAEGEHPPERDDESPGGMEAGGEGPKAPKSALLVSRGDGGLQS